MAWNRPNPIAKPIKENKSKNRLIKFLILGLVLASIATLLIWFFSTPDIHGAKPDNNKGLIKEVEAAKSAQPKETVKTSKALKPVATNEIVAIDQTNNATIVKSSAPKSRLVKRLPRRGDIKWLFKHAADREIQCILDIQPGEEIFAPSDYRNFNKQFEKAIKEPIEMDANDTPEEREVREAVIEIREELKQRKAKGEDLAQVMRDTQDELIRMGEYKADLKNQLWAIKRDKTHTPQDVLDAVDAVNIMLKEKGIGEIKCPAVWKYQAKRFLKERDKERQEEEK